MNNLKSIYYCVPRKINIGFFFIFLPIIIVALYGCQTNPAYNKKEFGIISSDEELKIGRAEHPKIVKKFGGIYTNSKLQNYIESLGKFIVSTSEMSSSNFTFTILDTPIVNAFALPGGYIYLTRGLILLCQNEAQLAGVIAHEIGHVTARHAAQKYTRNAGTNLLANILSTLTKNNILRNIVGQSSSLYLLSFSRDQEYEADELSTRYMIRAGFDPREMAHFLRIMEKYSVLMKKVTKSNAKISELLLTHPTSSKRVDEIISRSKKLIPINPIIGEEIFLKKIDGVIFGDSIKQGVIFRDKFIHKDLQISFEFDSNFHFINNPDNLVGLTNGKSFLTFELDSNYLSLDKKYLSNWGKVNPKLVKNFQIVEINNLKCITGTIINSENKIRLVALSDGNNIYKFAFISTNQEFQNYENSFKKIILSFKKIDSETSSNFSPPTIFIGDYFENEAKSINIYRKFNIQKTYAKEIFSIFNDLDRKKGRKNFKVKLIY